jgi:hypothetical protein
VFATSGLAYVLRLVTTHARAKTRARAPIDRTLACVILCGQRMGARAGRAESRYRWSLF